MKKIGIIGLGKMGEALAKGLSGEFEVLATTRSDKSAKEAAERNKISVSTDNEKLIKQCDVILLCVKPHQTQKLLSEIAPYLNKNKLLISVVASKTIDQLKEWTANKVSVVRVMPNTPVVVGEGMTVIAADSLVTSEQMKLTEKIFNTVGKTAIIEESLMDGATGLSGCGPAYVYLVIEALSEGGVKVGLPRKTATLLAAQTLLGAAKMCLSRGEHPAALKDEGTTPGGVTIDGLMALEEGKLRVTLIKAVLASTRKSEKLRGAK